MSPDIDPNAVKYRSSVLGEPGLNLRYMHRRRVDRTDRNGDPLDGLVNLFTVAVVLALGLLLAALTGLGLGGVLSNKDMTIVTDPGSPDMQVLVRHNGTLQKLNLEPGQQTSGLGALVGQFYRLQDGTTIYVPASSPTPTPTPTEESRARRRLRRRRSRPRRRRPRRGSPRRRRPSRRSLPRRRRPSDPGLADRRPHRLSRAACAAAPSGARARPCP